MKRLVFGLSAVALMASAAFAQQPSEDTKVAALDTSSAAFTKLDADKDGRVSAIEAANDTKLASAFTKADADRDGYLSKEEFSMAGKGASDSAAPAPQSSSSEPAPK